MLSSTCTPLQPSRPQLRLGLPSRCLRLGAIDSRKFKSLHCETGRRAALVRVCDNSGTIERASPIVQAGLISAQLAPLGAGLPGVCNENASNGLAIALNTAAIHATAALGPILAAMPNTSNPTCGPPPALLITTTRAVRRACLLHGGGFRQRYAARGHTYTRSQGTDGGAA